MDPAKRGKRRAVRALSIMAERENRCAANAPYAPDWSIAGQQAGEALARANSRLRFCLKMDRAWTVMLYKQKIIPKATAAKVLRALKGAEEVGSGFGGESLLLELLDGDGDTANVANYGRTLQEPMSRLQLRGIQLETIDDMHKTLAVTLDVAEEHAESIMAGRSHMAHAQPTTFGAYLLSIHDGLARGLDQLELAYRHTDLNSGGCGALAGAGWPADRQMVTELLGMGGTVEPAYDCEAGQDFALTTLFAAANIATTMSRAAMDFEIWGMEDLEMISVEPRWFGVSSLMPQKAHPGSSFEQLRIAGNGVIAMMVGGVLSCKNEPHQDVLPIYGGWQRAIRACGETDRALIVYQRLLPDIVVHKDRMLQLARKGFSGAPDLAIELIRDKGYGGRRAHRIVATMVRLARERGLDATQVTGELLDEAAGSLEEKAPGLTTERIRDALDPVEIIQRHTNLGDPNPGETRRLIQIRRGLLAEAKERQATRRAAVEAGARKLDQEIAEIIGEANS